MAVTSTLIFGHSLNLKHDGHKHGPTSTNSLSPHQKNAYTDQVLFIRRVSRTLTIVRLGGATVHESVTSCAERTLSKSCFEGRTLGPG